MKKVLLVLPLAVLLVNCSTSHRSRTSTSASINPSTTDATISSTTTTGLDNSALAGTATMGMETGLAVPGPESGYDPNNYMQNPDKYLAPYLLTKTGGWTYSKDWRRNTNFPAEAEGNWELVMTPEVASSWIKDTSRPETYASYWTTEAVAARQEARMIAAARTMDSIRALDSIATMANVSTKAGRTKAGKYAAKYRNSAMKNGQMGVNGTATADLGTNGNMSASATTTGSGTTGLMGTGGMATTSDATSSVDASTAALTAVNGNKFMMPGLSLHIGNGSFTAYTGCNDAIGTILVNGNNLHFNQTTPTNNIQCVGGFDQTAFLDRLTRATNFDIVNNQIRLKKGEEVLMVFAKKAQ